uniref:Uncharacterized protein n=1 Tax=Amphimedon queenslandica TaxID=400682 RepID=A0A1X7VMM3_AMPQE
FYHILSTIPQLEYCYISACNMKIKYQ